MEGYDITQLDWFTNQLNITTVAAVVGLALTICQLLYGALQKRETYKIECIDYAGPLIGRSVQFLVRITNKSQQQLVITKIEFNGICCELEPKMIRGKPGFPQCRMTPNFPICIYGKDARDVYLEFVSPTYADIVLNRGTRVTFQIQTILHLREKTILLEDTAYYLHIRHQPEAQRINY